MNKYLLFLSIATVMSPATAQISKNDVVENWDGVEVLIDSYGRRISPDGNILVGETFSGTTYYNRSDNEVYFYNADFGRGNVVANNGWIVGNVMAEYEEWQAVVMADGKLLYPDCFNHNVYGNIHGITPDATRICGVIGGSRGYSYQPYVCDIDENGNFGKLQMLPTPSKDVFNQRPQYSSAVWISADGNTVAGQVIDARGVFVYPIVYTLKDGEWSYSFPAEKLFNPEGLPLPAPLGDIEHVFADAPFPNLEDYMTPEEWAAFEEAVDIWNRNGFGEEESPYSYLYLYMSEEKYLEYVDAEEKYLEASILYNEMMNNYWDELYKIADTSVFFVRNAMALSPNGRWLAMSAQIDEPLDPYNYVGYYVPYLMDLETGDAYKIGGDHSNLLVNQVMNDGTVICNTIPGDIPASSYIYTPESGEMRSFYDYVNELNPAMGEWMTEYLTGDAVTGVDQNGNYNFRKMTVTGVVSASDDFSVFCGGVDGYNIGKDMYLTYLLDDLTGAGVEGIEAAERFDGVYTIYNLQGVKVMETRDASALGSLQKGLYIINGRKTVVK